MGASVGVNGMSVVHSGSGGTAKVFPDVCKTPGPDGPHPVPYPNSAESSNTSAGTITITCDGHPICHDGSNFSTSTGDEGGVAGGGVKSGTITGTATFVSFSFDVTVEGSFTVRAQDLALLNDKNTLPTPVVQGPVVVVAKLEKPPEKICAICDKKL